jgi:hypothetical protein
LTCLERPPLRGDRSREIDLFENLDIVHIRVLVAVHTLHPGATSVGTAQCPYDWRRAFAVKVATKRLPVSPFSGFNLYHHFRNDAFYDLYNLLKVQKTGKREVVLLQPLPQTLYRGVVWITHFWGNVATGKGALGALPKDIAPSGEMPTLAKLGFRYGDPTSYANT